VADGATGAWWQNTGTGSGIGAAGGRLEAKIPVKPGETLEIVVGGTPSLDYLERGYGGYNGGGAGDFGSSGSSYSYNFGGGGGRFRHPRGW
jgi:hypothetical protein